MHQVGISAGATAGDWRGIFAHKNVLGSIMAMGLLVESCVQSTSAKSRAGKYCWVGVQIILLANSRSATAMISLMVAFAFAWFLNILRHRQKGSQRLVLFVLPLLVLVLAICAINFDFATAMIGKSPTLTGRIPLWRGVIAMIRRRPLLGYGYSGFWGDASWESKLVTSDTFDAYYSHDGYLEILLSVGVVGFTLVALFIGSGIRRAVAWAATHRSPHALWPFLFLTFFLFHNITECSLLWQNSLEWAVCIAVVISSDPVIADLVNTPLSAPVGSSDNQGWEIAVS
jgi:O-antigen ligase